MSDFALSEAEFRELYQRLRRTYAWGPGDRLGTLNSISRAEVVAADDLLAAESALFDRSAVEGVDFPVHVLAINAMGMHLLDYLDLDALAERCTAAHRARFMCVVAPLRLREGTGSPVNPIAIF